MTSSKKASVWGLAVLMIAASLLMSAGTAAAQERHGDGRTDTLTHGKFQSIKVYKPKGEVEGVVLLLSGDNGWDARAAQMAKALTAQGAMVAGINTRQLMAKLDADTRTEAVATALRQSLIA